MNWIIGQQKKVPTYYEGYNIIKRLTDSIFGKIQLIIASIFTAEDISNYVLPKLIIIGNESTGKSSLLENITKCQLFPRDSKLCTKCPIRVKMTKGVAKYSVSYYENNDDNEDTVLNKKKKSFLPTKVKKMSTKDFSEKSEIYKFVAEYMNNLPQEYISDEELIIEISDENVPTLELYDLPGIRTYPPQMAETSLNVCKKYLVDKNAIVLCVVPATTPRLTSCQSIALITEHGMQKNTILALTMADRLQLDNMEELLINRITKKSDELKGLNFANYIAVVNRPHNDNYNLNEHDKIEEKWFHDNILCHIPPNEEYKELKQKIEENITVSRIIYELDILYSNFIKTDWKPRIIKAINEKIKELTINPLKNLLKVILLKLIIKNI